MYIPEQYAQVNFLLEGTALPRGAQVTFGIQTGIGNEPPEVIENVKNAWEDSGLVGGFSSRMNIPLLRIKFGPNDVGMTYDSPWGWTGGDDGQPLPPNVALLVTKQTHLGGKKYRGRLFFPGLTEAVNTGGGQVDAGSFSTYVNGFNLFRENLEGASNPMVILHSKFISDDLIPVVRELSAQSVLATQRRRLRR